MCIRCLIIIITKRPIRHSGSRKWNPDNKHYNGLNITAPDIIYLDVM